MTSEATPAARTRKIDVLTPLLPAPAPDAMPLHRDPQTIAAADAALDALITTMIDQRAEARAAKDWAAADRIRDAIAAAGVVLEDGPEGTHWSLNNG